ncbi:hypothetical protein CTA1_7513 [Colletotrichum tanaceti]|uniref:Uncharacterized protein n=1 Tax=Colletotrichum tanaceti TaxID=1306861 RepID=A0A4U6XB31_9PEZI|nr:hypothetical protein CTA1_7513 [Colletotrichum tanaceti]
MGTQSQKSAYNGHSTPKQTHVHSTEESKKQLAKRRTSMYLGQPASEEPSAYRASFRSTAAHDSGSARQARVEADLRRIMQQSIGE